MNGVRSVDRKLVEAGLANGFRGFALAKVVILPASLPAYLVGLRQGLSLGWMFVVAAEIMGASRGLGYLLIDGQATGRPAIMMSSVILFAICGKVSDGLLGTLSERWLLSAGCLQSVTMVRLEKITKRFTNGTLALEGIDLEVAPQTIVSIVGPVALVRGHCSA